MAGFYESLNKQNYLKAMSGAYQNYGIDINSMNNVNGDNGNTISATISLADNIKNAQRTATDALSEENHDDDATWFEKIGNSIMNVFYSLEEGVLNFADAIGDFAMGATGAIAGAVGNTDLENAMKQGINTDWQAGVVNFTKSINDAINPYTYIKGGSFLDEMGSIGQSLEDSRAELNEVSENGVFGSDFNNVVGNIAKGVGEMIPSIAIGKIVPTVVDPKVAKAANIVTQASLGTISGMGKGYSTVSQEDGDLTSGSIYAGIKGVIQGTTRGLSAGLGGSYSDKLSGGVGKATAEKILGAGGSEKVATAFATITNIATDSLLEGGEEFIENTLDPVLKQISYDQEALEKAYGTNERTQQTLVNSLISAGISALTTGIVDTMRGVSNGFQDSKDLVDDAKQNLAEKRTKALTNGLIEENESIGNMAQAEKYRNIQTETKAAKENIDIARKELQQASIERQSYEYNHKNQDLSNDETYKAIVENEINKAQNLDMANNKAEVVNSINVEEIEKDQSLKKVLTGVSQEDATTSSNETENGLKSKIKADRNLNTRTFAKETNKYKYDDVNPNDPENVQTKKILQTRVTYKQNKNKTDIEVVNKWQDLNSDGTIKAKLQLDETKTSKQDQVKNARVVYKCDNVEDTTMLIQNRASDSADGKIVTINGDFVGNSKHDMYIDTADKAIKDVDITMLEKVLTDEDHFKTTYFNKSTGEAFVYSNGVGLAFKSKNGSSQNDLMFTGTTTTRPTWATDENKVVFEKASRNYKSPISLLRNASRDNSIGKKDLFDSVESMISSTDKIKYDDDTKDYFRKMVGAWDDHNSDDATRTKLVQEFTDKFYDNYFANIQNEVYSKGGAAYLPFTKEDFQNNLKTMLDQSSKMNDTQTERFELEHSVAKLESQIKLMKRRNLSMDNQETSFNSLKKKIDKFSQSTTYETDAFETMNSYTAQYGNLKYDRSLGGITAESLEQVLNGELQYDEESLTAIGLEDLYDEEVESTINTLKSHFKEVDDLDEKGNPKTDDLGHTLKKKVYVYQDSEGNTHSNDIGLTTLTLDDAESVVGLLRMQNRLTSASTIKAKAERKKMNMNLLMSVEALQYGNKRNNKVLGAVKDVFNSTLGQLEKFRILFGEGTPAYQVMVSDVVKDKLDQAHMVNDTKNTIKKMFEDCGVKDSQDKLSAQDVTIKIGGKEETFKKGVVMELVLNSKSADNWDKLSRDGFSINGQKHNALSEKDIVNMRNSLSESELQLIDNIFDGIYNGDLKKALNKKSVERTGIEQFTEDNYVNREIDPSQIEKQTVTPNGLKRLAAQKKDTITIKRNGNRSAMTISDMFNHLDRYIESASEYIYSDHIKNLNTAMNMRGSQDYDTQSYTKGDAERGFAPDSIYGMFARLGTRDNSTYGVDNKNYNKETQSSAGAKMAQNWLKTINGIDDTDKGSSKLTNFFNKAMAVPIGANPATYIKMYLDPLRMIGKEVTYTDENGNTVTSRITWTTFAKGLLNAFNVRTLKRNATDTYRTIQNSSKYYEQANAEKYALNSSVYGVQKNKVVDFFTSPLQSANNGMMSHIAFPVMQSLAKQMGYGDIGSEDNTTCALNMFDVYSTSILSNSDKLDMSDLRSGRNGQLIKAVFGIYGGDSQKKMEQLSDVVLGTTRSKRRVTGYNTIIDKYEGDGGTLTEYKQRTQKAYEDYQKVLAENEQTDTTGKPKKSNFDVMIARNKWQSAKTAEESVSDTITSFKQRIEYEKNVVQNPKNNVAKGTYVLSAFIVAGLAESAINSLNNVLKGKKDEESIESYLTDFAEGATYSWIPYVSTLVSAYKYSYNGITPLQLQGITNAISSIKSLIGLADGINDPAEWSKALKNTLGAVGSVTGIPFTNLWNYTNGAFANIDDMAGNSQEWINKVNSFMSAYNSTTLKQQANKALESGNLSKATEYTQANMAFFKAGAVDWNTAKEIAKTGTSVRDIPDLIGTQKEKFMEVYTKANSSVKTYINSRQYSKLSDDETKGKALTKIYTAYYEVANAVVMNSEEELNSKLAKALYAYYKTGRLTADQRTLLREYKMI